MEYINEHFYTDDNGKMKHNCNCGCCMKRKYLLDGEDYNNKWISCNQSCLVNKNMIGKSCTKCEYTQYGKKL